MRRDDMKKHITPLDTYGRRGNDMRLIDANAFIDFMKSVITRQRYDNLTISRTLTVEDVLEAVISELDGTSLDGYENAPTIDPVKHGRWLRTDAYPHRIYCSSCFATFIRNDEFLCLDDIPHNWCPNCGAVMDGDSE